MAEEAAAADAALQLLRRLPPEAVVSNLGVLLNSRPELTEELLSRVDQPLQVAADDAAGRDFLLCDYNRDADSYRRAPAPSGSTHEARSRSASQRTTCVAPARGVARR